MLEVTVKTLDSQSKKFSIPDDITVQGFKSHIVSSVNIPADRQRIIYQGRVLRDGDKLNASGDINGKVLHLVERLPTPAAGPSPQQAQQTGPRVQPARMGTPVRTMPHGFTAATSNIMGPFPAPGGNFNSNHFVQQMLQQAFNGMGARPMGPTVVRGSVRHPSAPGQDARTEIQIHITPQGADQSGQSPGAGVQPTVPTSQTSTNSQQSFTSQRQTSRPQSVISEPRRQLNYVEYLITKLEERINRLESENYEQGREQDGATDTTSSEATDNHREMSGEGTSSGANDSSIRRHPTLPEVGRVLRRVTSLETRFLPFLTEYTDFLEKDPAFSSTQSPEYKKMMGFANTVLRAQRAMSIIHRVLSSIVIPLSETPPRSMLIQGDCQRPRTNPPPHARHVHNVSNLATAGQYLNQPQINRTRQARPHGQYQFRMPMVFGPFRAPGSMPRPMFRFGPIVRSGPPPHQSGLYGHPPPPSNISTAQHRPALPSTQTPVSATTTIESSSATAATPPSIATNTAGSTIVEVPQPEYVVQVTSHIQPNININITPAPLANATATASQDGVNESIQVGGFSEPHDGAAHGEDAHMDESQEQIFGFQGSMETDEEGNVTIPMEANLPNIPGLSQDALRQIVQSVQGSVQQVMNVANQSDESGAGNVSGATITHHNTGRISVQGLPGGQNQIPVEIANIIGQTVQNIVMNHLNDTEQPDASAQQQANNDQAATADASPTGITPSDVTVQSSSSVTITTASGTTQQENAPLLNLLSQIGIGQFGTRPSSTASPMPSTSAEGATGSKTNSFKMPVMNPVPNSINAMVRGQFPEGMLEDNVPSNIISFLIFVVCELLTMQDTMLMMAGMTDAGNPLRDPLRQGISDNWFNGQIPNRDEIEGEVDRQSDEARSSIMEHFSEFEPKMPDISIVESNLSLFRHAIRRILHIVFLQDAEQFSHNLWMHMVNSLSLMVHLNTHILKGSENDVIRMFMTQLEHLLTSSNSDVDQSPAGNEQIRSLIASQIIPFTQARPISQVEIDQFVMNAQSTEVLDEDVEVTSTSSPTLQDISVETDIDMEKPSSEKENEEKKDDKKSESSSQNSNGAAGSDPNWRTMVPQEWVSVISSDIEKQKNLPEQPAYSEAYMAGMPANKRRKI